MKTGYLIAAVVGLVVLVFFLFGKNLVAKATNDTAAGGDTTGPQNGIFNPNRLPGESVQDWITRRSAEGWRLI